MHVRGELAFGAIAQTGRAQASQNTYEHIINTNSCSAGTPDVTLDLSLNSRPCKKGPYRAQTLNVTLNVTLNCCQQVWGLFVTF